VIDHFRTLLQSVNVSVERR